MGLAEQTLLVIGGVALSGLVAYLVWLHKRLGVLERDHVVLGPAAARLRDDATERALALFKPRGKGK